MDKLCKECDNRYEISYKFCPECGSKLNNIEVEYLLNQVNEDYKSVYGVWRVKAEEECTGVSNSNLGIYEGYIDEIAIVLARKPYRSLIFESVRSVNEPKHISELSSINIKFDYKAGFQGMQNKEAVKVLNEIFKERDVEISESDKDFCFELTRI